MSNPDPKKVEVLMVWYSVFCTVMDADEINFADKMAKLIKLRTRLREEYRELENELRRGGIDNGGTMCR